MTTVAYKQPDKLDPWPDFMRRIYADYYDADPGYYALKFTQLRGGESQKFRFAVAWCAYYNLGIAAEASERQGALFWQYLHGIYDTAKRATERRHFRGKAGRIALEAWQREYPKPEKLVEYVCGEDEHQTYFDIRRRGGTVPQYGDYFYWKWCDLHEVLGFGEVDMVGSEKYSPKTPQQGAELIYRAAHADGTADWAWLVPEQAAVGEVTEKTYAEIVRVGRLRKVPPQITTERKFGIQEAETVCCVYKQMANGSYTYGTRTAKAVRRLRAAGKCKTALAMTDTLLGLSPYTEAELNAALDSLTAK